MMRAPESDFWQVGVVRAPIADWLQPAALTNLHERVAWLPDPGPWRYLADPFGVRRGEATHVFVEAFDYHTKRGVIEHHELGPNLEWQGKDVVLARPFHLSYPFLIEDHGEVFMVPESQGANEIALYRARTFPGDWVREAELLPGIPGAEASLIRNGSNWWMFFTLVGAEARDQRELHVAYAPKLTGPWQLHHQNPVVNDRAGGRPGGTPFTGRDGRVILPVQDCSGGYGGALRFLRFKRLEPGHIVTEHLPARLTGNVISASHGDGFHTLSKCGELTLVDAKRTVCSWARPRIEWQRRITALWS